MIVVNVIYFFVCLVEWPQGWRVTCSMSLMLLFVNGDFVLEMTANLFIVIDVAVCHS